MYNLENFKSFAIFGIVALILSLFFYLGFRIGFKQAMQELETATQELKTNKNSYILFGFEIGFRTATQELEKKNYNLKIEDGYIKMECDEVDYSDIKNKGKIFCKKNFKNL